MALSLNEETKTVVQKTYDRCCAINIRSVLNSDLTTQETINMFYEHITQIDETVINKTTAYEKMYSTSALLDITWVTPDGRTISGLDVMMFIKNFNDNYETALVTNQLMNG